MRLRTTLLIVLLAGPLLGQQALARISQIGNNSVGDPNEGFVLALPFQPQQIVELDDDSLIVENLTFNNGTISRVQYRIKPLHQDFDLSNMTEEEVEEYFIEIGWQPVGEVHCGLSFGRLTSNYFMVASTWGGGLGVTVVGPNSREGRQKVARMVQNIRVDEGKCAWN